MSCILSSPLSPSRGTAKPGKTDNETSCWNDGRDIDAIKAGGYGPDVALARAPRAGGFGMRCAAMDSMPMWAIRGLLLVVGRPGALAPRLSGNQPTGAGHPRPRADGWAGLGTSLDDCLQLSQRSRLARRLPVEQLAHAAGIPERVAKPRPAVWIQSPRCLRLIGSYEAFQEDEAGSQRGRDGSCTPQCRDPGWSIGGDRGTK